jgi:chromosome segregation ATPase
MTEGVASAPLLNPLMRSWLEDVSTLLEQVNELGTALEAKKDFVAPEIVAELRRTIADLQGEVRAKDSEIAGYKNAERILRDSLGELQREAAEAALEKASLEESKRIANADRDEAQRLLAVTKAECDAKLEQNAREYEERDRERDAAVKKMQDATRQLRVDLAKEKIEGTKRAEENLRKEHALDVAKNHQIGKNKGIAIATAYIAAAKEEDADLERASQLASSVVIQSAQRLEAGLVIHEAAAAVEGHGNGGLPGTQKEIKFRVAKDEEDEENTSRNFLRFSRKMR